MKNRHRRLQQVLLPKGQLEYPDFEDEEDEENLYSQPPDIPKSECKGRIYRAYVSNVCRANGDVFSTIGLRFQVSRSCPGCPSCERIESKFRELMKEENERLFLSPRSLVAGSYYEVTVRFGMIDLKPVFIPSPDVIFQSEPSNDATS